MKFSAARTARLLGALALLPLATGLLIVHYRDAAVTHYPTKAAMVEALRAGTFPFLNPYASLGQPLAGNPNHAILLPDTLFFAILPLPMAFGLHFALALALAWIGARRWARAEGASRDAAEAAGIAFAASGPFLSAWTFYNAGMTLAIAPWVLAAVTKVLRRAADGDRAGLFRATRELGVTAALILLAGEPVIALLTAAFAAVRIAAGAREERNRGHSEFSGARRIRSVPYFVLGGVLAALLAAPQIALTWQAMQGSVRNLAPYGFETATSTSVHPARILEQATPFPFGRPDLMGIGGFDRHDLFQGRAPYLWTLHLGWGALILLAMHGGVRSRPEIAAALIAAFASLLSLGSFLPGARAIFPLLSVGGRLRYPVKWWDLVALALVPLVAAAAERRLEGPARRRSLAIVLGGVLFVAAAATAGSNAWAWSGLALGAAAVALLVGPRRLAPGPLLAALALPSVVALAPLFLAVLDRPPGGPKFRPSGRVWERLLPAPHSAALRAAEPALTTREYFRRAANDLWAIAGATSSVAYAFDHDPDGSYSFYDRVFREAVEQGSWGDRVAELRLAGVSWVLTREEPPPPFEPDAWIDRGRGTRVWHLEGAMPSVRRATRVLRSPTLGGVVGLHRRDDFDPRTDVVLRGDAGSEGGARERGLVRVLEERPSLLSVECEGGEAAVIVWSRTFHPAWRATVDGQRVAPVVADGHLVGVPVPAGAHEVRIFWDRGPVRAGSLLLAAGLGALLWIGRRGRTAP